tara:strand:+ start:1156 stop:1332 length:177 start_codon:yes stop_codon:yes gene_type:complete
MMDSSCKKGTAPVEWYAERKQLNIRYRQKPVPGKRVAVRTVHLCQDLPRKLLKSLEEV